MSRFSSGSIVTTLSQIVRTPKLCTKEMTKNYPTSSFTGTDITDIFNGFDGVANVQFQIADTLKGLSFADGIFDYVFQRLLMGSFRDKEWPIDELARVWMDRVGQHNDEDARYRRQLLPGVLTGARRCWTERQCRPIPGGRQADERGMNLFRRFLHKQRLCSRTLYDHARI
ncbi:hypothetical protein BC937DRAFT_94506 [Endogone sp. FLAS-F59071]|nr:hypothetical protein BC937DRAFT_94506 [Endogone sp. FLAS-F59071]|eukprot:RUS20736.1 hypothetical protein BC937DRAFT_94506 [Endogone sp. FLAS-F59071]